MQIVDFFFVFRHSLIRFFLLGGVEGLPFVFMSFSLIHLEKLVLNAKEQNISPKNIYNYVLEHRESIDDISILDVIADFIPVNKVDFFENYDFCVFLFYFSRKHLLKLDHSEYPLKVKACFRIVQFQDSFKEFLVVQLPLEQEQKCGD